MRRPLAVLSLALAACGGARPSSPPDPGRIQSGDVDRSADPCTDFYAYANGAWRRANPIPAGKPQWSRRLASRAQNRRDLQALLTELAARRDHAPGTPAQQLGDHYAACLDGRVIEAAGLTPLRPLLAELDAVHDLAGLVKAIAHLHELGVPAPFAARGGFDFHDPARVILHVLPGDRVSPDGRALMSGLFARAGIAETDVDAVVALETRLAEGRLDDATASDPALVAHPTPYAGLVALAPRFPWDAYFAAAGLPRAPLNVTEPTFLSRFDRELGTTPISVWKRYLAWRLLAWASPWIGGDDGTDRAARCVDATEAVLGETLGREYAERHFPPAAKAKVEEIVGHLRAVLTEAIAEVDWMTPETRQRALAKLAAYDVMIGYPDAVTDTSSITIRRDGFLANVMAARRFEVALDRGRIGQPIARSLWGLPPSSSAAYIDVQLNLMVLPAGFLQAPAFDLAASEAANYGALGTGIAHDLTHAIDPLGADFDAAGRPVPWWTDEDRRGYHARAACVVAQYDGYLVEPGRPLEGKRVSGEAIGDLAGLRIAYRALGRTRPGAAIDGFTPAQQFFLSYGQYRGVNESLELQRQMVTSDSHPTARHRVNGPLGHTPAFREAFACPAEAAMVSEPRCSVW